MGCVRKLGRFCMKRMCIAFKLKMGGMECNTPNYILTVL